MKRVVPFTADASPRSVRLLAAASVTGAMLLALGPAEPASAQAGANPAPCTGFAAEDKAGDQIEYPNPGVGFGATATKGPDTMDLRGLFLNYRTGADGKAVLTANIQVTNLTKQMPAGARTGAVIYFFDFANVGNVAWVKATNRSGTFSFTYGQTQRVPDTAPAGGGTGLVNVETATTGNVYEGPDGVIEIVIPLDVSKAAPGTKIDGITSYSTYDLYASSDTAPDSGTKSYTVEECPTQPGEPGSPEPGPAPDPGPGSDPGPSPDPGPTPTQNPGSGGPASPGQNPTVLGGGPASAPASGTLPLFGKLTVAVAADKGRRKTVRKRGFRVRVRCSVQCNATVTATVDKKTARKLRLGKKAIKMGTGKASITKAGRIPFYARLTRKAKKALGRKRAPKFAVKLLVVVTDRQGGQLKRFTKTVKPR